MTSEVVADLMFLVDNATLEELMLHSGDKVMRKHRKDEKVGVQGMVLDAFDDAKIDIVDAHRLLSRLQGRINGNSEGLCRVDRDGNVIAIESLNPEKKHGR